MAPSPFPQKTEKVKPHGVERNQGGGQKLAVELLRFSRIDFSGFNERLANSGAHMNPINGRATSHQGARRSCPQRICFRMPFMETALYVCVETDLSSFLRIQAGSASDRLLHSYIHKDLSFSTRERFRVLSSPPVSSNQPGSHGLNRNRTMRLLAWH